MRERVASIQGPKDDWDGEVADPARTKESDQGDEAEEGESERGMRVEQRGRARGRKGG